VTLQELKPLSIGVVLVLGIMLAGPLTSQASPAARGVERYAVSADAGLLRTPKPRGILSWFGAVSAPPTQKSKALDLAARSPQDFADWDRDDRR
jgi:hypothetical protein